jgi:biopolymer transport protein TolR
MSEINVTPFVDVMLVLLIIFMVTAPLLSAGVPVNLPEANAKPLAAEKDPVAVTVDSDGRVFIKETEVPLDELVSTLSDTVGGNLDQRIYIRGDRSVSYGAIMRVMGDINGAGFRNIGLVSLKEPNS